jgi:transcriptional regulator with XRE-family HTH domain
MKFDLIESIRKKKGFTQAELAKMIDFSTTGYQKMIYVGDIKVTVLEKIAQILGIDIMVFFNKSTTTKTYKAVDIETAAKDAEEAYERANHYQKELLACYKTISTLQAQLLIAAPEKAKQFRLEVKRGPKPKLLGSPKAVTKTKTKAKAKVNSKPVKVKAKAVKKRKK